MKEIIESRKQGIPAGIASYCSSTDMVLEALMLMAKQSGNKLLIEATANQVNQYGGYIGMTAYDFYNYVTTLADTIGVQREQLILGGDHLGPLIWCDEPEAQAMEKAKRLVYQFAHAGFTKIHLDTSMKLGDDGTGPLSDQTVARRGIALYEAAMDGYYTLRKEQPEAKKPVFIIGSEVPIPGGAQEAEEAIAVTTPQAFENTVSEYKAAFKSSRYPSGMDDVIAIVVQPGVEFGDEQVFYYNSENASQLCQSLGKYPNMVFEGHSTDYQTKHCLKHMVEDGIAILKVGPALTFGLREALFALSKMESELVPAWERADFIITLEKAMVENPSNWIKHYHGNEHEKHLARQYSFSDRCRYYLNLPEVLQAREKLFRNLTKYPIPRSVLHQYMPLAYDRVTAGQLSLNPKELALDAVWQVAELYEYAVHTG